MPVKFGMALVAVVVGTLAWGHFYVAPHEEFLLRASECAGRDASPKTFAACEAKVRAEVGR